jgi:pullulanase/glycogen debranching enzyme
MHTVPLLQELRQERERSAALQSQLESQARTAHDSSSRSSTLADDNQKLKDAIERLNRTYQDQTNQAVQYMQEAGELRKKALELEQAAQSAQDAQRTAERKLQSVEKVRCTRWHSATGLAGLAAVNMCWQQTGQPR